MDRSAGNDCPESLVCREVLSPQERAHSFDIRCKVFVEEQHVPPELEIDEADEGALHFLIQRGEKALGTARLIRLSGGKAKIGRVAVLREARGCGAGKLLMEHMIKRARQEGFRELCLDAQLTVIPFYEKLGFSAEGDVFADAGILHRRMRRTL